MINKIIILSLMCWFTSCTISFQNISTHGTATDVVDEELQADADISPTVTIPVSPTGI